MKRVLSRALTRELLRETLFGVALAAFAALGLALIADRPAAAPCAPAFGWIVGACAPITARP